MTWITLKSGRRFDLENPTPDMFTIEDIAEGVAKYVMASNADFDEDRFYNIRTFRAIAASGMAG